MRDLLFPVVAVAFFVLAAGYIRACAAIAPLEEPGVVPDDPDASSPGTRP